jgi:hypothetical protein
VLTFDDVCFGAANRWAGVQVAVTVFGPSGSPVASFEGPLELVGGTGRRVVFSCGGSVVALDRERFLEAEWRENGRALAILEEGELQIELAPVPDDD